MDEAETSAKKVRSASARAKNTCNAMQDTIAECRGIQQEFTEAIKSLNRTCRRKYIELYSNTKEAYSVPYEWLEEEDNEEVRQQLSRMCRT